MITSKDAINYPISAGYYKADNSTPFRGGFTNKMACVTQAGWGVVQGVAAPCPVGQWSAGDGYSGCTQCPFGTTTNGTQTKESDCMIAPGFGWLRNSIAPCPVGKWGLQQRAGSLLCGEQPIVLSRYVCQLLAHVIGLCWHVWF